MTTQLHGLHRKTYDALFQDPVARNLEWQEVRSMLVALADAVEEDSDSLRIKRNGKTLVLHRPQSGVFGDLETLMQVRGFLKQSVAPLRQPEVQSLHLVVVIDDERARVYRTRFQESVPQRITPYHPAGMDLLRECIGAKAFESDTYFEMALRDAQLIPNLEGSTHINLGLATQFIPRYFARPNRSLAEPG